MSKRIMEDVKKEFSSGKLFSGVMLTIPNTNGYEVIVNPAENTKEKLRYYENNYNAYGVHKRVPQIKIIAVASGNTFQKVYDELNSYRVKKAIEEV